MICKANVVIVFCELRSAFYCWERDSTRRADEEDVKKILRREYQTLGPIRYCYQSPFCRVITYRPKYVRHLKVTQLDLYFDVCNKLKCFPFCLGLRG